MLARREPHQNCNPTCYGFVRVRTACILYTWIGTTLVRMAACNLLRTAAPLFCALLDWCASSSSSKTDLKMLLPHHLRSVLPLLGAAFVCTHPGADATTITDTAAATTTVAPTRTPVPWGSVPNKYCGDPYVHP